MNDIVETRRPAFQAGKIVLTFFLGGAFASLLFAGVVGRPNLKQLWFAKASWMMFPTGSFWGLVAGVFLLGFTISYVISVLKGWVPIPTPIYRLGLFLICAAAIPVLLSFLSKPNTSLAAIIAGPIVVGIFLSAAMFVLTWIWFKVATVLMVLIYFAAPLIADIPDLFISGGYGWFDGVTFFLRCSLLLAVCGWWLGRAQQNTTTITAT